MTPLDCRVPTGSSGAVLQAGTAVPRVDLSTADVTIYHYGIAVVVLGLLAALVLWSSHRREYAGIAAVAGDRARAKRALRRARDAATLRPVRLSASGDIAGYRERIDAQFDTLEADDGDAASDAERYGPTTTRTVLGAAVDGLGTAWTAAVGQRVGDSPRPARRLARLAVLLTLFGSVAVASEAVARLLRVRPGEVGDLVGTVLGLAGVAIDALAAGLGVLAGIPGVEVVAAVGLTAAILVGQAIYAYGWLLVPVAVLLAVALYLLAPRVEVGPEDVERARDLDDSGGRLPSVRAAGRPAAASGVIGIAVVAGLGTAWLLVLAWSTVAPETGSGPGGVAGLAWLLAAAVVGVVVLLVSGSLLVGGVRLAMRLDPGRPVRRWVATLTEAASEDPNPRLAVAYLVARSVAGPVATAAAALVVVYAVGSLVSGTLLAVALAAVGLVPWLLAAGLGTVLVTVVVYPPARRVGRTFLVEAIARQQVRVAAAVVGMPTAVVGVVYVLAVGFTGRALPSALVAIVVGLTLYKVASVLARARANAAALVPEGSAPVHVLAQCAVLSVDPGGSDGAADPQTWYYVRLGSDEELLARERERVVAEAAAFAAALFDGREPYRWLKPFERWGLAAEPTFFDRPPSAWAAQFGFEYGILETTAAVEKLRERVRKNLWHAVRAARRSGDGWLSPDELQRVTGSYPDPVVARLVAEHCARGDLRQRRDGAIRMAHDPFVVDDSGPRGPLSVPRHRKPPT